MSTQSAGRKAQVGVAFLKEAILEVLADSQARGEGYVTMEALQSRLGMPEWGDYFTLRGTAYLLKNDGEVIDKRPGVGRHLWSLP